MSRISPVSRRIVKIFPVIFQNKITKILNIVFEELLLEKNRKELNLTF